VLRACAVWGNEVRYRPNHTDGAIGTQCCTPARAGVASKGAKRANVAPVQRNANRASTPRSLNQSRLGCILRFTCRHQLTQSGERYSEPAPTRHRLMVAMAPNACPAVTPHVLRANAVPFCRRRSAYAVVQYHDGVAMRAFSCVFASRTARCRYASVKPRIGDIDEALRQQSRDTF